MIIRICTPIYSISRIVRVRNLRTCRYIIKVWQIFRTWTSQFSIWCINLAAIIWIVFSASIVHFWQFRNEVHQLTIFGSRFINSISLHKVSSSSCSPTTQSCIPHMNKVTIPVLRYCPRTSFSPLKCKIKVGIINTILITYTIWFCWSSSARLPSYCIPPIDIVFDWVNPINHTHRNTKLTHNLMLGKSIRIVALLISMAYFHQRPIAIGICTIFFGISDTIQRVCCTRVLTKIIAFYFNAIIISSSINLWDCHGGGNR